MREIQLGNPAMRTIALHVARLDADASYGSGASTLSCVHAVMVGAGTVKFDHASFDWKRGDVIACPSGERYTFTAREPTYLLRVSDEPLMRFLDWLRPIDAVA